MKRITTLLLVLLLAFSLWGEGKKETEKPIELKVLLQGVFTFPDGSGRTDRSYVLSKIEKEYPDIKIEWLAIDTSDGSLLTMTAMLAANEIPNVYVDTMVRASAFLRPDFALALDEYVTDLDKYRPDALAPYRRDGKLLGLPEPAGAQGMCINLDIMKEIGYTVPDNWTIQDFLEMAAKVERFYGGEKYATGMFAANQSGDYLINNWFAAFGCEYYKAGDYSKTTIAETNGSVVHGFFQELMEAGYIPKNSAELTDDDYVLQWARGELAATAFFQAWVKPYRDIVAAQGYKPFEYKFVSFPRASWVKKGVPSYSMNAVVVVHNTGDARIDAAAAKVAQYLNDDVIQTLKVENSKGADIPSRIDVKVISDDPYNAQIMEIVRNNGIFDVGLTNPKYAATRPQHFPILQKVLNLEISPKESIEAYAKAINEALSW